MALDIRPLHPDIHMMLVDTTLKLASWGDEIYETIAKESVAAAERNLNELYNELELDIQKEQGVAVALHRLATLISDEVSRFCDGVCSLLSGTCI